MNRHCARAPLDSYPNDPHINHTWPGGYGALSRQGALQAYTLGKRLRSRYAKLLPSDGYYSSKNMQILSSSRERCIMTAQSMLAGFMPPFADDNALPLNWQPTPVNSVPIGEDYVRISIQGSIERNEFY